MKQLLTTLAITFLTCTPGLRADLKVDVGGQGAAPEPGWTAWITPGSRLDNTNLFQSFTADFDSSFTISVDNVDTRLRGGLNPAGTLTNMLQSAFKDSGPIVLRFQSLNAGSYELKMWHHDSNQNGKASIDVLVSDADGTGRLAVDNLLQSWGPGLTFSTGDPNVPGPATPAISTLRFRSDGLNEVAITVSDNDDAPSLYPTFALNHTDWNESFIAGFQVSLIPEPSTLMLSLLGGLGIVTLARRRAS
jgi:hypothetical protein